MARTKLSAYRLSERDRERIKELSELLGVTRTDVVRRGIQALARQHGVLGNEAVRRLRDLMDTYGEDAEVALAVQERSSRVPVSIGGRPCQELVAASWPQPLTDGRSEPVPVSLWIRDSDPTIKFEVEPIRPGSTLRFPASDLWHRRRIAPEQDAQTIRSNAAVRRAAGYPSDDDEEVERR